MLDELCIWAFKYLYLEFHEFKKKLYKFLFESKSTLKNLLKIKKILYKKYEKKRKIPNYLNPLC